MNNRALACVLTCSILFATVDVVLKGCIVGSFGVMQVNITRFLLGGLALLPFALRGIRRSGQRLDGRALWQMAWLGFIGITVSMTLYQMAVERVPANVVAVIFCCNSAFVVGFAFLLLGSPITRSQVAALALACLGITCIVNPLALELTMEGVLLSLAPPITFAIYAVLSTPLSRRYSAVASCCGSFLMGSLELIGIALLGHIPAVAEVFNAHGLAVFTNVTLIGGYVSLMDALCMLYVSVGVSGVGYACYFLAVDIGSPFTASLAFFFKPVIAPILAVIFLGETIGANGIAGIALILAGSSLSLLPNVTKTARWMGLRRRARTR